MLDVCCTGIAIACPCTRETFCLLGPLGENLFIFCVWRCLWVCLCALMGADGETVTKKEQAEERKNVLRGNVWKSLRNWLAPETGCPFENARTDKVRMPIGSWMCPRPPVYISLKNTFCSSDHIQEAAASICSQRLQVPGYKPDKT